MNLENGAGETSVKSNSNDNKRNNYTCTGKFIRLEIMFLLNLLIYLIVFFIIVAIFGESNFDVPDFISKCFQVVMGIIFISVLLYVLIDGFKRYNKCKNETPEEYEKRLKEEEMIEEWQNKF